jgi:hypothetical protein
LKHVDDSDVALDPKSQGRGASSPSIFRKPRGQDEAQRNRLDRTVLHHAATETNRSDQDMDQGGQTGFVRRMEEPYKPADRNIAPGFHFRVNLQLKVIAAFIDIVAVDICEASDSKLEHSRAAQFWFYCRSN